MNRHLPDPVFRGKRGAQPRIPGRGYPMHGARQAKAMIDCLEMMSCVCDDICGDDDCKVCEATVEIWERLIHASHLVGLKNLEILAKQSG